MIISASRRTDIPALYSRWFEQRITEGFCTVSNPFNPQQICRVSLRPEDVDAIIFWTRHARPIFELLPRLNADGYLYYFQYTITGYGPPTERRTPPLRVAIETFKSLAERLPRSSVVWRYDPVIIGPAFPAHEHIERFDHIAKSLEGYTDRVVVSLLSLYKKTERRLGALFGWEDQVVSSPEQSDVVCPLLGDLASIAKIRGMQMEACAQLADYSDIGIPPTKCIDNELLNQLFGGRWISRKDPGQRRACRCIPSKDIGAPDTCTLGCAYCYATRSDAFARQRFSEHDRTSPSLHGRCTPREQ